MSDIIKEALEEALNILTGIDPLDVPGAGHNTLDKHFNNCRAALAAHEAREKRMAELEGVMRELLQCPALDDDFNDPDWGDGETALAVSRARATLNHKETEE